MAEAETSGQTDGADSKYLIREGPRKGVRYPLKVIYCDVCDDWPLEYTEYHPNYEKAKEWMEKNLSDELQELYLGTKGEGGEGDAAEGETQKKKRQTRGGKGVVKMKKKQEKDKKICLSRAPRGKRKYVTVVSGLGTYDIDLKKASKFFAGKFSCGSSVTGDDEIVIQGDCKYDLIDIIPEHWPEIDEDSIDDLGDMKRS